MLKIVVRIGTAFNRQTSGESASLPRYDEGTESAEVATSDTAFLISGCCVMVSKSSTASVNISLNSGSERKLTQLKTTENNDRE